MSKLRRFYTLLCLLCCSVALSGCEAVPATTGSFTPLGLAPVGALAGVEVLALVNTKRTLTDRIASGMTGKDCSIVRKHEGGEYCVMPEQAKAPVAPKEQHCYRTLASVTCYDSPNPYGSDTRVGSVPQTQRAAPYRGHASRPYR